MNSLSTLLDKVEALHNKASDTDFVWFPFNFLRPQIHEEIGPRRRIVMALLFGGYFGIFYGIKRLLWNEPVLQHDILKTTALAIVAFFSWFSLVTATFWNRRARRETNPTKKVAEQ